jgi:hypothetical protein
VPAPTWPQGLFYPSPLELTIEQQAIKKREPELAPPPQRLLLDSWKIRRTGLRGLLSMTTCRPYAYQLHRSASSSEAAALDLSTVPSDVALEEFLSHKSEFDQEEAARLFPNFSLDRLCLRHRMLEKDNPRHVDEALDELESKVEANPWGGYLPRSQVQDAIEAADGQWPIVTLTNQLSGYESHKESEAKEDTGISTLPDIDVSDLSEEVRAAVWPDDRPYPVPQPEQSQLHDGYFVVGSGSTQDTNVDEWDENTVYYTAKYTPDPFGLS